MIYNIYQSGKLYILALIAVVIYVACINFISSLFFVNAREGYLIKHNGQIRGSYLLGQEIYNSQDFLSYRPREDSKHLHINNVKSCYEPGSKLPLELYVSSASKQDAFVTLEGAYAQIPCLAYSLKLPQSFVKNIIDKNAEKGIWPFFTLTRVNVNKVNYELFLLKEGS